MEERISAIYNDCWKAYKQYLNDHDMEKFNLHCEDLIKKYDGQTDIEGLVFWWAGRVQGLHDVYTRNGRRRKDE